VSSTTVPDESGHVLDPAPRRTGIGRRAEALRSGLLSRFRAEGWDLRNTWQVVAGAILVPVGIAVIVLGWYGAAHGRVDQQQIPYLISGGILGLAAVVLGGFFFWAHWLYRIYDQADLHHQQALREQAEFYRSLLNALGQRSTSPAAVMAAAEAAAGASSPDFVATPSGSNYHSLSCPIVANKTDSLRPVSRTEARTMKPCRICEPKA
jgi:hypothetical protein